MDTTDRKITCGRCGGSFTWDETYRQGTTAGRYGAPPGWGSWGTSVYCPHCGFLVAHGTREGGEEGPLSWYGSNAESNEGSPDSPSSLTMWGHSIPIPLRPLYEEEELDLAAISSYEPRCIDHFRGGCRGDVKVRDALPGAGKAATRCDAHWEQRTAERSAGGAWQSTAEEGKARFETGDLAGAIASFEQAFALGLPPEIFADTICFIGLGMVVEKGEVDRGVELCRRGLTLTPYAPWQARALLGMVALGRGDTEIAIAHYEGARRFALTQWFVPDYERRMVSAVERSCGRHLDWPPGL